MFPQIFGKYVLEKPLAEGGMARVFLAKLRGADGFEKRLVVKQIRVELASDEAFVRRFVEEAKTTVELSHPNIVPVYELGIERGVYYLAMEFCEGVTLARLLHRTTALTPHQGAYLGIELCRALDYAHRKGIVHRDVTPRNVLIDAEGGVRLIDFGIAQRAQGGARDVFGTPGFMPPEQLRGDPVGPSADLFALAGVLFEAWVGRPLFATTGGGKGDLDRSGGASGIVAGDSRLDPLNRELLAIRPLLEQALDPDPSRRLAQAEQLSRPLRRLLSERDSGDVARSLGERVAMCRPPEPEPEPKTAIVSEEASQSAAPSDRPLPLPPPRITGRLTVATPQRATFATRPLPSSGSGSEVRAADRPVAKRIRGGIAVTLVAVVGAASWGTWRAVDRPRPPPLTVSTIKGVRGESSGASGTSDPMVPTDSPASSGSSSSVAITPTPRHEPLAISNGARSDRGSIHLRSRPPSRIEVDGQLRASGGRADLTLAAGGHRIQFICDSLGETLAQTIQIDPGAQLTVVADFTAATPRITRSR